MRVDRDLANAFEEIPNSQTGHMCDQGRFGGLKTNLSSKKLRQASKMTSVRERKYKTQLKVVIIKRYRCRIATH